MSKRKIRKIVMGGDFALSLLSIGVAGRKKYGIEIIDDGNITQIEFATKEERDIAFDEMLRKR